MKNLVLIVIMAVIVMSCKDKTKTPVEDKTGEVMAEVNSEMEKQEEWTILFDGTSFDAWKEYNADNISEYWKLEDGAMVLYPPEKNGAHNLVTKKEYTDFVLSLEWKISEGGNSGIFWGVHEDSNLNEAYQTGPEIQVLDNQKHPDAKNGTTHQAGALYDMLAPSKDVTKPVGEWNTCVITINHKTNVGRVVLNEEKVVEFPVNNPEWSAMIATSKFADWDDFGKYTTGKIGLQDHSDMVSYRNIKIKEL